MAKKNAGTPEGAKPEEVTVKKAELEAALKAARKALT